MKSFNEYVNEDVSISIDAAVKENIAKFNNDEINFESLVESSIQCLVNSLNKQIIEQALDEVSAAAAGRAAEHEFSMQHQTSSAPKRPLPPQVHKPAPKKSAFTVMHHDGQGWKVSHHENIHSAAKTYAGHVGNKVHKVKIVDHAGKVVHANHEAVDENMDEFIQD